MQSLVTEPVSQLPTPLPPLRPGISLTDSQWHTLVSVFDAIIPSIAPAPLSAAQSRNRLVLDSSVYITAKETLVAHGAEDDHLISEYLAESATTSLLLRDAVSRLVFHSIDAYHRKKLFHVLSILEYDNWVFL